MSVWRVYMLLHGPLKKIFRVALATILIVCVAIEPLFSAKKLSSGVELPGAPVGAGGKMGRLGALTMVGCLVGAAMGGRFSDIPAGVKIGGTCGFIAGLSVWSSGSVHRRLGLFNTLYNSFLLNPVLETDISLTMLINQSAIGETQAFCALVKVVDMLDVVIQDLADVLVFAKMLRESPLVQDLGDVEFESLVSKITHLQDLLEFARFRRDVIVNHPSYGVQKEFYKRYGIFTRQHQFSHEAERFDHFLDQWRTEQLALQLDLGDVSGVQLPLVEASECSICGLIVPQEKRYATRCQCVPGRHFYHHGCVTKVLQLNNSVCLRCKRPATVHSAFEAVDLMPIALPVVQEEPVVPVVVHSVPARSRCALCRGVILRNKAYKTACLCREGDFFYHHECIKTHLASAADCPKCHLLNPEVHSDFNDGFQAPLPVVHTPTVQPVVPAAVVQPTAPVVNSLHECALCGGKLAEKKRYKTKCACNPGCYYYHHLCIADTLKKSGNHCPKCFKENTTVHSAF